MTDNLCMLSINKKKNNDAYLNDAFSTFFVLERKL